MEKTVKEGQCVEPVKFSLQFKSRAGHDVSLDNYTDKNKALRHARMLELSHEIEPGAYVIKENKL